MLAKIHLLDFFSNALINAKEKNYTGIQPIAIRQDKRMCLFNHPPSSITFTDIQLEKDPKIVFGCGIKEVAWPHIEAKVIFTLTLKDEKGKEHILFKLKQNPKNKKDQNFHDQELSLKKFENQKVSLTFKTNTAWKKNPHWCWSGWSDPFIEHSVKKHVNTKKNHKHPLVLFITSDALRKDFLGCYGHPIVKTENLNALAKDSALFTHARAQSTATLSSYASFLTGLYSKDHHISGEWGTLPSNIETLPGLLKKNGFETVFCPSEEDLNKTETAITPHFSHVIPCSATPAQEGEITTRKALKWLKDHLDKPTFMWIQYFDTHPPHTPKEPFKSLYYKNDPTTIPYRPEWIEKIRGMESIAEIDYTLAILSEGMSPDSLYERLIATAKFLKGQSKVGPDLAHHLLALGKKSTLDMSKEDFAVWLEKEAQLLIEKRPSSQFMEWLKNIREQLIEIEKEILSWLKDVKDYKFPLSQYMSMVTYFDSHLEKIIQFLKDEDLYDNTMIIVSSPHGELLSEHSVHYHHHAIAEEVLRIPLICKPFGKYEGKKINGIFDSIDLFPTIAEALDLKISRSISGVSRFKEVKKGSDILPHDSIAIDFNSSLLSITHEPFVFIKALKDAYLSPHWKWKKGDKGLFRLQEPMNYRENLIYQHPNIAHELEKRLNSL